jgi:SAM-dependent methyltransferase
MSSEDIRQKVREAYGKIAVESGSCCGGSSRASSSGCCGGSSLAGEKPVWRAEDASQEVGYSQDELQSIPAEANLGLGCGNPVALASLQPGETVLDLGSGAGIDAFLAAKRVGPTGRVIGVDMTAEMLQRARQNIVKSGQRNVEFRLGEIENLPLADQSIDVAISNCVINLSPDKGRVFQEIFRVLRPGGRIMISDIVLDNELPPTLQQSLAAYVGCISGALMRADYLALLRQAGFVDIDVVAESKPPVELWLEDPIATNARQESGISEAEIKQTIEAIVSLRIAAKKPIV